MTQQEKENLLSRVLMEITSIAMLDVSWSMKTQLKSPEVNKYTALTQEVLKKAKVLEGILTNSYTNNQRYIDFITAIEDKDTSEVRTLLRAKIRKDVEWPCDFGMLKSESENIELKSSPAREVNSEFISKLFK